LTDLADLLHGLIHRRRRRRYTVIVVGGGNDVCYHRTREEGILVTRGGCGSTYGERPRLAEPPTT